MAPRPSPGRPRRPDWTDVREGDDVYALLKGTYRVGRALPHGPNPHDYTKPEQEPAPRQPAPLTHSDYAADYRPARDSKVSGARDESQPLFRDEQAAHLNDTPRNWTRGYINQSPHPAFDSGPSGFRYDTKIRK